MHQVWQRTSVVDVVGGMFHSVVHNQGATWYGLLAKRLNMGCGGHETRGMALPSGA